jgi:pSer/pThr/pTyr-binding forkhead associated (FHA) protein
MQVNLLLLKKDGSVKPFNLPSAVTTIGRRQDCDLCLPISVASRKHCEINMDQGRLMVRDLSSKNGTFVNGQKIEEVRLKPGDQLRVGPVTFVIQIDGNPADVTGVKPIEPVHEPMEERNGEKVTTKINLIIVNDLANADLSESQSTEIHNFPGDDMTTFLKTCNFAVMQIFLWSPAHKSVIMPG